MNLQGTPIFMVTFKDSKGGSVVRMSSDSSSTQEGRVAAAGGCGEVNEWVFVGLEQNFEAAPGYSVDSEDAILILEVDPPAAPRLSAVEEPRLVHVLAAGYMDLSPPEPPAAAAPHDWRGEQLVMYKKAKTGKLWCIQALCPHAGAHFGGGDIEDVPPASSAAGRPPTGPFITCPSHAWIFSVETGQCVSGARARCRSARTYDVRREEDGRLMVRQRARSGTDPQLSGDEMASKVQMRLENTGLAHLYAE